MSQIQLTSKCLTRSAMASQSAGTLTLPANKPAKTSMKGTPNKLVTGSPVKKKSKQDDGSVPVPPVTPLAPTLPKPSFHCSLMVRCTPNKKSPKNKIISGVN